MPNCARPRTPALQPHRSQPQHRLLPQPQALLRPQSSHRALAYSARLFLQQKPRCRDRPNQDVCTAVHRSTAIPPLSPARRSPAQTHSPAHKTSASVTAQHTPAAHAIHDIAALQPRTPQTPPASYEVTRHCPERNCRDTECGARRCRSAEAGNVPPLSSLPRRRSNSEGLAGLSLYLGYLAARRCRPGELLCRVLAIWCAGLKLCNGRHFELRVDDAPSGQLISPLLGESKSKHKIPRQCR